MTSFLKNELIKTGLYYRVRYSMPGRVLMYLLKPNLRKQELKERSFYRSFLPPLSLIFDIGANDGHKTVAFAAFATKVIACEPDTYNLSVLNARFRNKQNIIIEPFAVSDQVGTADLFIHFPGSALNTLNPGWKTILEKDNKRRWKEKIIFSGSTITVNTITLDALIAKHGIPDMIKIDVESNEKKVLTGLSHSVKYISFEVLLPEFLNDAMACMERIIQLSANTRFNYSVDESILLARFIPFADFKKLLSGLSIPHVEIIAMSASIIH